MNLPPSGGRSLSRVPFEGLQTLGVRVRQHDELAEVVTRRIAALPGIVHTTTMIAFQAYSRHDLDSMWGLGIE